PTPRARGPALRRAPGTRGATSGSRSPRRRLLAAAWPRPCLHSWSLPPGHHVMPLLTLPPAFSCASRLSSVSRPDGGKRPDGGELPRVEIIRRWQPSAGPFDAAHVSVLFSHYWSDLTEVMLKTFIHSSSERV